MYYIYHIEGVKIGCTTNLKRRVREQKAISWSILETHDNINVASVREIELQKQYGYRVDDADYANIINAQKIGSKIGNSKKYRNISSESQRKTIKEKGLCIGEKNGRAKLTLDKVNEIRTLWNGPIKYSKASLGRMFGVSEAMIRYIVTGKSWVQLQTH